VDVFILLVFLIGRAVDITMVIMAMVTILIVHVVTIEADIDMVITGIITGVRITSHYFILTTVIYL